MFLLREALLQAYAPFDFPNAGPAGWFYDQSVCPKSLLGDNSEWEPPESIPNSEVKLLCADGSAAFAV